MEISKEERVGGGGKWNKEGGEEEKQRWNKREDEMEIRNKKVREEGKRGERRGK